MIARRRVVVNPLTSHLTSATNLATISFVSTSLPDSDSAKLFMMNALIGLTTFAVADLVLSQLAPVDSDAIKDRLLAQWEKVSVEQWNVDLAAHNKDLASLSGRITNTDLLPQPEDLQQEWTKAFNEVKTVGERLLWPRAERTKP